MQDFMRDEPIDNFPVAMAYVPGSILTECLKIWIGHSMRVPFFRFWINLLRGDDVYDEC